MTVNTGFRSVVCIMSISGVGSVIGTLIVCATFTWIMINTQIYWLTFWYVYIFFFAIKKPILSFHITCITVMGLNWFILLFRVTGLRVCTCVTVMRLNWLILLFRITGLRVCILRLILISGQCTLYLFLNIIKTRFYLCAKRAAPTSVNNNYTM